MWCDQLRWRAARHHAAAVSSVGAVAASDGNAWLLVWDRAALDSVFVFVFDIADIKLIGNCRCSRFFLLQQDILEVTVSAPAFVRTDSFVLEASKVIVCLFF